MNELYPTAPVLKGANRTNGPQQLFLIAHGPEIDRIDHQNLGASLIPFL
jgi:hypothetical protein